MKIPSTRKLRPIAKRYGLRLIVLFGSQVSVRLHPDSDVDVAVWSDGSLKFARRLELWQELSEAFRAEVDLAVLDHAEPLLLYQVARNGRLLFENERGQWNEFKGYAYRYYWDTQKFRDALAQYIRRQTQAVRRVG